MSTRPHHNVTFAVLALGGISYALLQSLVAPALPDIQHVLHTSPELQPEPPLSDRSS